MIGRLRERVTLEAPQRTPDAGGGAAIAYAAEATVWAAVAPERGGEPQADQGRSARRYALTIRHRSDVAPGWRAVWAGRVLIVRGRREDAAPSRFLILDCEEAAP